MRLQPDPIVAGRVAVLELRAYVPRSRDGGSRERRSGERQPVAPRLSHTEDHGEQRCEDRPEVLRARRQPDSEGEGSELEPKRPEPEVDGRDGERREDDVREGRP